MRCECEHNTVGQDCSRCADLYNDKPFVVGSATKVKDQECKQCTCNNHATSCTYNRALDPSPQSQVFGSGGVCACQHNTTGQHCDQCLPQFYRPADRRVDDPEPCLPCNCNPDGSVTADCAQTDAGGVVPGSCACKANVQGPKCDECRLGFYDVGSDAENGCTACGCNTAGTVNRSVACSTAAQCTCKPAVTGLRCDGCAQGFHTLTDGNPLGCEPCDMQCSLLGCTGAGATLCVSCKEVKNDGSCVSACPDTKGPDEERVCQSCSLASFPCVLFEEGATLDLAVTEGVPSGHTVGQLTAHDRIAGLPVTYRIISATPAGPLMVTVDPATGRLFTVGVLDRETSPEISLVVEAESALGTAPPGVRLGRINITVSVRDINEPPVFIASGRQDIDIQESMLPGEEVIRAAATDPDSGINGTITYSIFGGYPGEVKFAIDARTGTITLIAALNFEEVYLFPLVVTAMDGGTPPLAATLEVILRIKDNNDNPPVFTNTAFSLSLPELSPSGTHVTRFRTTDLDTPKNSLVQYVIAASTCAGCFALDGQTGLLTLAKSLAASNPPGTVLTVRVTAVNVGLDRTQNTTKTLTLTVTDVNDHAPMPGAPLQVTVSEAALVGTELVTVTATDGDFGLNAELTYSFSPTPGTCKADLAVVLDAS